MAGAAGLGAISSYGGELANGVISEAVTFVSGNQVAGQVVGSLTYNMVKNFGSSYYVNQGLNWIDYLAEGEAYAN